MKLRSYSYRYKYFGTYITGISQRTEDVWVKDIMMYGISDEDAKRYGQNYITDCLFLKSVSE